MTDGQNSLREYAKKERIAFARYNRSHPHFKRNILIDAIISSGLVLIGFTAMDHFTEHARLDALMRSGGVVMTSDELIRHVTSEKIAAYWLGPVPGYKYTIICKDRQEIIITYLPQGVSLNHPDRFNLTIETYSKKLKSEQPARSNISSDRDDFIASDGTIGTTYSQMPQRVTFAMPNSGKSVEVQYPSPKRIYDVYVDGQRLKLISEMKPQG